MTYVITIANCDHLIHMPKKQPCDNKVNDDAKMHRSKCTNIIKKVLRPHFEDLKHDIGGNGYSSLLDESNDISIEKKCLEF